MPTMPTPPSPITPVAPLPSAVPRLAATASELTETAQPATKTAPQVTPWLPLREELRLSHGPANEHGSPTWTLHDQAAHKFFRIGWLEFEVLSRWKLANTEAITQAIHAETTLFPDVTAVQAVYDFTLQNNLVFASTPQDTERLIQQKSLRRTSLSHKILHGYLFLRIPLLAPDAWLQKNLHTVEWMFNRRFFTLLICAAVLGLYLISREWITFLLHLDTLWSWQHSLVTIFALGLAKTVHELGHAFAAKHLHLKVPRMGIALMCFTPVLWTDVTEAWKLAKRSDRLLVDMAGVGSELMLATTASLIWPLLPPSALKSAVLTLAGVTWLATLAVNANPFMRYDGYYILSDYWEVPGLQQRAFALARWHLRELLFGFNNPPPEAMPYQTRSKLILYAYGTWIYRFFLFMGIALLVYHLFFKALGLILMIVEIAWFLALPIVKEVMYWYKQRSSIHFTWQTMRSAFLIASIALLFIVPWHTSIEGAGVLSTKQQVTLYTQKSAQVKSILVQSGDSVVAGQPLIILSSPDIQSRITVAQKKLDNLQTKLALSSLDAELRFSYTIDLQEMQSLTSELLGLQQNEARLTIHAPFSSTFHDLPNWLAADTWVPERTALGIVTTQEVIVTAYVAEEEMERLKVGMTGKFYPTSGFFSPLPIKLIVIENTATQNITQKELPATVAGGIIPARQMADGQIVPEQALYKIICVVETTEHVPAQALSGTLYLNGKRRSFAVRFWQAFMGVMIRESGWS